MCRVVRPCMRLSVYLYNYLPNELRYVKETGHNWSYLAGTDDSDDIEKVIGSKVKVSQ